MDGTITIRPVTPADHPAMRSLYAEHYWRPHCLILDEAFYDWQIRRPPLSQKRGGDQSLAAFDEQGRLLAHLAHFPHPVWVRGAEQVGTYLISWLTHPDAQGRGIGTATMAQIQTLGTVSMGRSLSPPSRAVLMKRGFRYLTRCQRWVGILDAQSCKALMIEPNDLALKAAKRRQMPDRAGPACQTSRVPPSGAETLAWDVLSQGVSFARSQEYLRWRYSEHPRLTYDFHWLGSERRPRAWAVTRTETILGRPGRALRIVEFVAPPEASRDLAAALAAWGREQGCAFLDCFGLAERFVVGLVAAGGWNTLEEPELRLPTLLAPWDAHDDPPGVLLDSSRDPRSGLAPTDDASSFYLSKGDGNMDWPSWAAAALAA